MSRNHVLRLLSLTLLCAITSPLVAAFASKAEASNMTAVLRLKEKVSMEELADAVTNPNSPRYQKYYSPSEIRKLAAPSTQEYHEFLSQLKAEGFRITGQSKAGLWVSVEADSKLFEETFAARFEEPEAGVRRLTTMAVVPSRLSLVDSVIGLDNTSRVQPRMRMLGSTNLSRASVSQATIKAAYGFNPIYNSGVSGNGQHIAIATYMGFTMSDIRSFYSLSQLRPQPVVDQVTFNGTPKYDQASAGETELDAEFAGLIAPGAKIHIFASATNDAAGQMQVFNAILDDNRSKIVNYSWGTCEPSYLSSYYREMNKVFARAVAQGVNILVASGDSGSACQTSAKKADFPSTSPYVVAVGGTSFHTSGGAIAETAWSCSSSNKSCSGGGVSALFATPSWQVGLTGTRSRGYPDVSFNADPNTGEPMYYSASGGRPFWTVVGGTSMSAPHWAGLLALIGESRAQSGKGPVGFINPSIYSLSSSTKQALFNDIRLGSNGSYQSAAGWDAVTGWGSPKANAVHSYLSDL